MTTGYTDGTFKPQRPLIKRHAVVFMERFYDEILQAEESEDFTRGDMTATSGKGTRQRTHNGSAAYSDTTYTCASVGGCAIVNGRVTKGTINATTSTATIGAEDGDDGDEMSSTPGEGTTITMARAVWSAGYFQSQSYKQLLEELGYSVTEPSELELGLSLAYLGMSQGDFDFWVNSWYPGHAYWWALELPDGSTVGDHLSIVGNEMIDGGLHGFLITKSFADEHGVTHLDQLNDDPAILAAFDADDQSPGNGVADIYGCPESWGCRKIIESQIALRLSAAVAPWWCASMHTNVMMR